MNHQPYLEWMFASPDEALTADQATALHLHLAECAQCRQTALAWDEVERELCQAQQVAPAADFTRRWQQRYETRRSLEDRRQGLVLLGTSLGLAVFLFGLLVFLSWPLLQSPGIILWAGLYQLMRWLSILGATQQFLGSLLQSLDLSLSPLTWLLAAGVSGALCLAWVVSYRFLIHSKAVVVHKS